MNRQGAVPQSLRGIPTSFGGQQQPQQPGRSVSSRIPNGGKLGTNGSGWAFGGVPMGGAGLQNGPRQAGGNVSFAQSLSGSQPATPLDLSEFPSLSNTPQIPMSGQSSSLWATGGGPSSRGIGGQPQRQQPTPLSAAAQQENLYSPSSSRVPTGQGAFQFGGRSAMSGLVGGQSSQIQPSSVDDFPPLSRTAGGEPSQDRGASLMSTLGFGNQATSPSMSNPRGENGLLSAISASSRTTETRSPSGASLAGTSLGQEAAMGSDARQKSTSFRDDSLAGAEIQGQSPEGRNPLGAIGNAPPASKAKEPKEPVPEVKDLLAGMATADKWGIAGLRHLMESYPDYTAVAVGLDPTQAGIDMNSPEKISTQHYSLFDDQPPRPAIPSFRLPDCYNVTNVTPVESKIGNFSEDTLFYIFYANPGDITQHLAAHELNARNWRWHKKLHLWLTKDETMMPHQIAPSVERGFYIVWDPNRFQKDRRDLTLHYSDLDTSLAQQG